MASFRKEFSLDKADLSRALIGIFEEPGSEGNFVVNCFVWEALRQQSGALCLLSFKHSFNHYFHIGLKLGYNLLNQKFRAIVLEAQQTYVDYDSELRQFHKLDQEALRNLFHTLKAKCELLLQKCSRVFLIIDDISYLLSAGSSIKDLLMFYHYLRTLQSENVTVVILTSYSEVDHDALQLKCFLEHNSDIKFHISPLRTGSAQDINGSITMIHKDSSVLENFSRKIMYHYNLTERNIKLFPPGCL